MKTYTKTVDTQAAAQLFAELAEIPGVIAITHLDPSGRVVTIGNEGTALTEGGEETVLAVTAGSLRITSDRPDENGPLILTIPEDIPKSAVNAVIKAHKPSARAEAKTRKAKAKELLASVDDSKLTGEAKKLRAVLAELVED